jgi:hypothetical protein
MWSGVEPEPQQYNVTYLNVMKNIIELLESNSIFVLLDMHQDVLSTRTGGYDGIPTWLYDRFPPPVHPCKKIIFIIQILLLFLLDPWPLKTIPVGDDWSLG